VAKLGIILDLRFQKMVFLLNIESKLIDFEKLKLLLFLVKWINEPIYPRKMYHKVNNHSIK
jgi:hypothetical protein